MTQHEVRTVLVANRGEIAVRVIRTLKAMGIRSVAVYSDADVDARHVAEADTAVRLGPAPARQSYLDIEAVVNAARRTGAQAVHPGYGFLAENPDFAAALQRAGIIFIGPPAAAIRTMGDKIAAKSAVSAFGVPVVPGIARPGLTDAELISAADDIGYPILVKPSAGGGGKGMRRVDAAAGLPAALVSARRESAAAFGDDTLFLERFVLRPRHIEVQVLADGYGTVLHLGERECSLQRRHQKVIEEAPSPLLDAATRARIGAAACDTARSVDYVGAGTVEFIVSAAHPDEFFFMEMNTRLQVEHPVTELITGLDLVEQMISVGAGEKLAFGQADVKREGWAIECRINAEDPFRNFLPSTGRLVRFTPPEQNLFQGQATTGLGVRVDTGVVDGGEIPMYYDSMIAKLIVHGRDRNDAIARMREALNGFVIRGVQSNIPFQAALLAHPKFVSGDFNTGFIAEHYAHGFRAEDVPHDDPAFLQALAVHLHMFYRNRASGLQGQFWEGYKRLPRREYVVCALGEGGANSYVPAQVGETAPGQPTSITLGTPAGDRTYELAVDKQLGDARVSGTVNGQPFTAQLQRGAGKNPLAIRVIHNGTQLDAIVLHPQTAELHKLMPYKAPPDMSKFVLSPMPGLLVQVAVQPGQEVKAGERVAVIEAMKMENVLFASADGVVKAVKAQQGESLTVDQAIVEFE